MIDFPYLADITLKTDSRIVLLVADGLGGVPHRDTGRSELESAHLPNLDALAQESACGLTIPVLPGITPGSGPGHLALFGYDPVKYQIGRGVLEALGIGIALQHGDVAARGNFCTVGPDGRLTDRRAGRIPSSESAPLCAALDKLTVEGISLSVHHVKEHRFVLLLRGEGLSDRVSETDPGRTGELPLPPKALEPGAGRTAKVVGTFVEHARELLRGQPKANMAVLRGFSQLSQLPSFGSAYRLEPAAIAAYSMYRGLTQLLGMQVLPTGSTFGEEVETLAAQFSAHDFFYLHYKPADAAGEDGDFEGKVRALEQLDAFIPRIRELKPDVLVVAGDHATPALLAAHSWHPVPLLVHSRWTKGQGSAAFNERACRQGALGTLPATQVMLLALAHAGKLTKYGP